MSKYLSVTEVAATFNCHQNTVYSYIHDGRLPAALIAEKYRVLDTDVDEFIKQRRVK